MTMGLAASAGLKGGAERSGDDGTDGFLTTARPSPPLISAEVGGSILVLSKDCWDELSEVVRYVIGSACDMNTTES